MSRCLYTSFFTPDYAGVTDRLVKSLKRFNLDTWIAPMEDSGEWIRNCAKKPTFLYDMRSKFPDRPIVWLDADAEVVEHPEIFELGLYEFQGLDAAVCEYTWPGGFKTEVLSGTIYVGNGKRSDELIEHWIEQQEVQPEVMDQRTLRMAVNEMNAPVGRLPVEYCFIRDLHRECHPNARAVIVHHQESRNRKAREAGMA